MFTKIGQLFQGFRPIGWKKIVISIVGSYGFDLGFGDGVIHFLISLFFVDDGANGTERKAALSRVVTLMTAQGFSTDDPTALAIALG